eukprot:COSAG05_NODE_10550_length_559_cov_1.226087_1_plen_140_part_10
MDESRDSRKSGVCLTVSQAAAVSLGRPPAAAAPKPAAAAAGGGGGGGHQVQAFPLWEQDKTAVFGLPTPATVAALRSGLAEILQVGAGGTVQYFDPDFEEWTGLITLPIHKHTNTHTHTHTHTLSLSLSLSPPPPPPPPP